VEWPGSLRMAWTRVSTASVPRRAHFRRPLPDALPGLLSGAYEGTRIPLHTHEALLVVLPITRFVVLGGGAPVPAGPGDICLSNMLDLHGAAAGAMHCQARILLVSPDLLHEVAGTVGYPDLTVPRFGSTPLPDPALAQAFSALWEELERPVKSSQVTEECRTLLQELVHDHGVAERPALGGKRTDPAIRRVLDHLRRHVAEPQALQELAGVARISKSYLVREFHRVVGLPPHAYHLQLRIARAARLLTMGVSLSRAASEAGFADQSHLSRRFKTAYGLTPLGFARAVRPATGSPPDGVSPTWWPGPLSFTSPAQEVTCRVV
jgi:AraC-like DNA-binding protein